MTVTHLIFHLPFTCSAYLYLVPSIACAASSFIVHLLSAGGPCIERGSIKASAEVLADCKMLEM